MLFLPQLERFHLRSRHLQKLFFFGLLSVMAQILNCACCEFSVLWVMYSKSVCDLNCVCSFRMSFLCVFVCLYISNCSRVFSFCPFLCMCSISKLSLMFWQVCPVSMRWLANVDSAVEWSAFMCSLYLWLKLRPVWPMQKLLHCVQFSLYTPGK